jgi:hypothetical protein
MSITGGRTIIVTGKYIDFISGAGETGTVTFTPSVPSLSDSTDVEFLITTPYQAILPSTNNSFGPGTFSITIPCTDNTELYPQGFTYTVTERISNLTRITKGVQIPSTLGSTADLTVILKPYI